MLSFLGGEGSFQAILWGPRAASDGPLLGPGDEVQLQLGNVGATRATPGGGEGGSDRGHVVPGKKFGWVFVHEGMYSHPSIIFFFLFLNHTQDLFLIIEWLGGPSGMPRIELIGHRQEKCTDFWTIALVAPYIIFLLRLLIIS